MKVYIDTKTFRCHTENPNGDYREVETNFFYGMCDAFIEGHCYDDSKGYVQIYPWKPYNELATAQHDYERGILAEYAEALNVLGVNV